MAMTYREWLRVNPDGNGMQYQEYKTGLAEKARQANALRTAGIVETSGTWAQVLGHYHVEWNGPNKRLHCLLDGRLVDYVNDGDTLLTLAVKAFEHEREHHA